MSAFHIYGAGGQKVLIQPPNLADLAKTRSGTLLDGLSPEQVEQAWAEDIAKRVRSKAVSMSMVQDRDRGRQKPTPVTYDTLRLMYQRSEWCRAIVLTRKRQITGVKWDITLKDTDDPSGAAGKAARQLKRLFERPMMYGSQPQSTHWQQWMGMLVEDELVLDRACFEKERDGNGWPVALYPVDGATIRPNIDDRGAYYRDAYIQVVDGLKVCEFPMEDLACSLYNPTTDVKMAGYGMSPLETLVVSVTSDLHAAKYNGDYFEKGAVPEGLLSLGEEIDPEAVDAFRAFWLAEVQGKAWSLPIMGGSKNPEFISWRDNNRDMQFMEYQSWLLQKMCAVFEISKEEFGAIEDVNRSTAEVQDSQQQRKGITPQLLFWKHVFDLEVIGEHGAGLGDYLEFSWEEQGETAEEINAKFSPLVSTGTATRAEWRDAHGLDAAKAGDPGAEGLDAYLSDGTPSPLPSGQDMAVMGAAHDQQRQDEQAQQGFEREDQVADRDHARQQQAEGGGGSPTPVPWDTADPDHPAVKAAMDDHDRDAGIGPRHVGKTHPLGHDRHPPLTEGVEDLTAAFDQATGQLVTALVDALA